MSPRSSCLVVFGNSGQSKSRFHWNVLFGRKIFEIFLGFHFVGDEIWHFWHSEVRPWKFCNSLIIIFLSVRVIVLREICISQLVILSCSMLPDCSGSSKSKQESAKRFRFNFAARGTVFGEFQASRFFRDTASEDVDASITKPSRQA